MSHPFYSKDLYCVSAIFYLNSQVAIVIWEQQAWKHTPSSRIM